MSPRVCAEHVEASPQTSGEAIRSIYPGLQGGYGIGSADERRVDSPRSAIVQVSPWGGDFVRVADRATGWPSPQPGCGGLGAVRLTRAKRHATLGCGHGARNLVSADRQNGAAE
jgi:hypothetical protein